eukprot:CAMPEP_0115093646 /NCGR_PEP_ID=MMETSP0227-20121206/27733_1 /TAXON_ID=89957 /ORGANISM="Polarella glacialis, Strain CCMP 1383" /LENGTH=41 /DNA_ID= /DNA_START= /DNA_END= /DNA_ORIENTATION=
MERLAVAPPLAAPAPTSFLAAPAFRLAPSDKNCLNMGVWTS